MYLLAKRHMFFGVVAACILPVSLGVMGLFEALDSGNNYDEIEYHIFLPIVLCFTFGTPIAAGLACRQLRHNHGPYDWRECLGAGVGAASAVHFLAVLLHILILSGFAAGTQGFSEKITFAFMMLMISGLINIFLWAFVTLPFSLFCATVFRGVTKFLDGVSDI